MELKYDRSLIPICHPHANRLIERGYAKECLSAIRFQYRCDSEHSFSAAQRNNDMHTVMEAIAQRTTCYQYDNGYSIPYDSRNWDLFFWCNIFSSDYPEEALTEERDYSYFILSFNKMHSVRERENILSIVLDVLKQFEQCPYLYIAIQYSVLYDEEKIKTDAAIAAENLLGKKCVYRGMTGKIVVINDADCDYSYYFMKSRARTKGYALEPSDVLLMAWEIEE